ncbi:MAG: GH1 family beta-glucosidase [Methylacidiphilales bacterium]|nr:GH1 family beta-glucosidase [Candidatus Methylacidiphilales bacterium]
MNPPYTFPRNFVWGFATAAPQIEGAAFEDGKGESIWDRVAHTTDRIHNHDTLDVACDHYHLYKTDFALMRKLGAKHYRLSLAWPRIYPQGRGAVNQKGVDFYHRLIDSMLAHGITPWVTMFHWDLPQALEDEGGWRVRGVAEAFATYADTIVREYGDRVKNWITLNEIVCFTRLAYGGIDKAPFTNEGEKVVNQTYHHAILCHGHGVRAVREHGGRGARVGLTDNPTVPIPLSETKEDIAAARTAFIQNNTRIFEPIFHGRYATDYLRKAGADRPIWEKGDFDLISLPTDFLGLNLYTGEFVRAGKGGRPEVVPFTPNYPCADSPWLKLVPEALYWGPRWASEIYGAKAIYITENGAGYDDQPPVNGEVLDVHRRNYVRACLKELHRAIQEKVLVKGYFLWSFMDNFEWQDGYNRRFGVVYTDFVTQKRTPKLSAQWYSRVMAENRLV